MEIQYSILKLFLIRDVEILDSVLYLEAAIKDPGRQGGGHGELQRTPGQGQRGIVVKLKYSMFINSGAGKSRHLSHNLRHRDGGRHRDHHQDLLLRQGHISFTVLHSGGNRSHDK